MLADSEIDFADTSTWVVFGAALLAILFKEYAQIAVKWIGKIIAGIAIAVLGAMAAGVGYVLALFLWDML